MTGGPWTGVEVAAFDAYGTLLDVASPVARHAARIGPRADELSQLWRRKQLEYSWLRSLMRSHADFAAVTADALEFAMESLSIDDEGLRSELLDAYQACDAYPDVAPALKTLRDRGIRTAVLSNGSPAMLGPALTSQRLAGLLDEVISVEDVRIYKPDPSVYALVETRFGVARERIGFVSSNPWDVAGAAHFGLLVAWLTRTPAVADRLPGHPVARIDSLSALPALL